MTFIHHQRIRLVTLTLVILLFGMAWLTGCNTPDGVNWVPFKDKTPFNYGTNKTIMAPSPSGMQRMVIAVAPTNRVKCVTNCPPAKTNVLFFWLGDQQWNWGASLSSVTNYRVYYGPNRDGLTNVVDVGLSLKFLPTNVVAGPNLFAVSAMSSQTVSGLPIESDLSPLVPVNVFREWLVEDWSKLKGNQVTRLAITTNYFYLRTNLTGDLFALRVRGTNQALRLRTDYVGVAWR